GDNGHGDAGRDQAVLDGGCAGLVVQEASDERHSGGLLTELNRLSAGWPGSYPRKLNLVCDGTRKFSAVFQNIVTNARKLCAVDSAVPKRKGSGLPGASRKGLERGN